MGRKTVEIFLASPKEAVLCEFNNLPMKESSYDMVTSGQRVDIIAKMPIFRCIDDQESCGAMVYSAQSLKEMHIRMASIFRRDGDIRSMLTADRLARSGP